MVYKQKIYIYLIEHFIDNYVTRERLGKNNRKRQFKCLGYFNKKKRVPQGYAHTDCLK